MTTSSSSATSARKLSKHLTSTTVLSDLIASDPQLLANIRQHEQHTSSEDNATNEALLKTALESLHRAEAEKARLQQELLEAKKSRETLDEEARIAKRQLLFAQRLKECQKTTIGGPKGIHPASLDVRIEEWTNPETHTKHQLAWIPVIVWPIPLQAEGPRAWYTFTDKDGQPQRRPNYDLGSTSIVETLQTILITDPAGKQASVSFRGYAGLNLVTTSPDEIARRLDRRERQSVWATNSADSSLNPEADLALSSSPLEDEGPAFTPSEQPTQRESRPTTPASPHFTEETL